MLLPLYLSDCEPQAWEHICGEDARQEQEQEQEASLKSNRFRLLRVCAWSLEQDLPDHFKVEVSCRAIHLVVSCLVSVLRRLLV